MRLELVKRAEHSALMAGLSPVVAVMLTMFAGGILFAAAGHDPLLALYKFFIEPLTDTWSLQELVVKATPLVLIACGLSVCYLSNTWNIGAEGQFVAGAILGSVLPVMVPGFQSWLTLPLMLLMGALGGALYALVPALLKTRFNTNEILSSLMLVYVAGLALDYLVRGPWRDPGGYNFPESRMFSAAATMPVLGDGRMSVSALVAVAVVVALAVLLSRTIKGFEIRVIGESPRAGSFAGFSARRMTVFAFALSGALAGLAGIMEVSGSIGQLLPTISPGYGFTAIIVAFLGRLNPLAILVAGLVLALSYLGGEAVQASMGMSDKIADVMQGMLLFFVLACDTLILYRIRLVRGPAASGEERRA
ncbi:ABC transporter permease [Polymorphum gilvum]|uniref:ABC transporter, permease protein n=1 Tax=Polymorphum gilvum (strain LMG 25793 / CGMCC 1.9160 / SL003B-26A1) TaxID=991905 RepID=F2IZV1_POLGS|nr:ABC transporter permease [Polymorphum gilvum]ADZ70677.1 ABC transporter, permease protein [Polymorphum gilvum SL003B-26A1]